MPDLEIRNLHVRAGEKEILRGLELSVGKGEIHALMGPNGSGKSTLANAVMGHPGLEVTEGQIIFGGEDITEAAPDERARMGLFMAFQYPVSVPGVDPAILNPRETWNDKPAYDAQAIKLVSMFHDNFRKFEAHVGADVLRAAPQLAEAAE